MKFNKDEQETVMIFNAKTGCWDCCTNVPSHIRLFTSKIMEISGGIKVLAEHEGKPTSIRVSSFFKEDINLREALKSNV
ncbi:TPA: hypothetical protein QC160_004984 [Bacillus cereus]|uniref:hypothetical protein n=1 Tax=Bacillus TaxID=1386 RepID=UPI0007AB408C|nr:MULTISPECIES: hypothetical protein [Bacillus]KZD79658.1 hypothetical protein B4120_2378 [Bacillus cereus]MCI2252667.1 hypothetical protein [Bacillus cereus]MCQ6290958.1 hypothetical protein [Bacillus cereus]MCT1379416.1 hypothetical protein [Bacillus sp. p3-SID196]BCC57939.1 hypothetical protein BCJMU10_1247 [Bacillus cereus]